MRWKTIENSTQLYMGFRNIKERKVMLLNAKNGVVTLGDTEMDYISFGKEKKF